MHNYNPIPISLVEEIDGVYCVMLNLNTGLSLVSKKAIKAKIKEFPKWR